MAAFNEVLKLNPRAAAAQLQVAQLSLAGARPTRPCRCRATSRGSRRVTPTSS